MTLLALVTAALALSPAPGWDLPAPALLQSADAPTFGWRPDAGAWTSPTPTGLAIVNPRGDVIRSLVCDESPAIDAAWSRDGALVAAVTANGRACAWMAQTGAPMPKIRGTWRRVALGDSATLILADGRGGVEVRDPTTGQRRWRRTVQVGAARSLRVDPDLRLVAVAGETNGAAVLDLQNGRLVRAVFPGPAGAALLTATDLWVGLVDGRVRRWERRTWREIEGLPAEPGEVLDVDITRAGTQLAVLRSTATGARAEVWTLDRREPTLMADVEASSVPRARFDALGFRLLASAGTRALLWQAPDPDPRPFSRIESEPAVHRPITRLCGDNLMPLPVAVDRLPAIAVAPPIARLDGALALGETGALVLGPSGAQWLPPPTIPTPSPFAAYAPCDALTSPAPIATTPGEATVGAAVGAPVPGTRPVAPVPSAQPVIAPAPDAWAVDGDRAVLVTGGAIRTFDAGRKVGEVALADPAAPLDVATGARIAVVTSEGRVAVGPPTRPVLSGEIRGATAAATDPSREGEWAVGFGDGAVRVMSKGLKTRASRVFDGAVSAMDYTDDGRRLLAAATRSGPGGDVALLSPRPGEEDTDAWTTTIEGVPRSLRTTGDLATAVWDTGAAVLDGTGAVLHSSDGLYVDARLSADGRTLTTVDAVGDVRAVHVAPTPIAWVPRPGARVLSPDGTQAALIDGDRVELWNGATAARVLTLPPTRAVVRAVRFDTAGARLAVVRADALVDVWDVKDGSLLGSFDGATEDLPAWATFSPDAAALWTVAGPRTLVAWDVATRAELARVELPGAGTLEPVDGRPGRWALFALDGALVRLDTAGRDVGAVRVEAPASTAPQDGPRRARRAAAAPFAVRGDGDVMAILEQDRVLLVDAETGAARGSLRRTGVTPLPLGGFSADGRYLAVGYPGGRILVWDTTRDDVPPVTIDGDIAPPAVGAEITHGDPRFEEIRFARLTDDVIVATQANGTRRHFNWKLGLEVQPFSAAPGTVTVADGVGAVLVSDDGTTAWTGHDDGGIRRWDLRTGTQTALLRLHVGPIRDLAQLPDGHLVSAGEDGTVRVWTALNAPVFRRTVWTPLDAVYTDGVSLAVHGVDGVVRAWSTRTGQRLGRWRADDATPMRTPDEVRAALAAAIGAAPPTPIVAPEVDRTAWATFGDIVEWAALPTGAVVAYADGRLRIWDTGAAVPRATMTALSDGSWVLDSSDGRRLSSPSLRDRTHPPSTYAGTNIRFD